VLCGGIKTIPSATPTVFTNLTRVRSSSKVG